MLICVNGTLMRGLALSGNMEAAGAGFVAEARTAPTYRLWSIDDRYPGMLRSASGGACIDVEIWDVDPAGLMRILEGEPPGLSLGRVEMEDGRRIWGVLAEPYLVEGHKQITSSGGWRNYVAAAVDAAE